MGLSCYSIAQNRIEGVWNRTLLAGVESIEILTVQFIIASITFVTSFIEIVVMTILTFDVIILGSIYLLTLFGILISLSGTMIGIAISATSDDLKFISVLVFATIQICAYLNGAFW